jgi:hypothetical protein
MMLIFFKCERIRFWGFVHRPMFSQKRNVSETDLFPSSGKKVAPTLLGPLERASLNHWTL